jgi:hypothetical protein
MGYYDNYLKRVNRYGNTLQERIQGKREHDFEVFMKKSPNQVRAWNNEKENEAYSAILQTKEYDQDEVVDYLLVSLDKEIPMGTIIYTKDSRHKEVVYEDKIYSARRWINYAVDPYTSAGYNRYTVVELESELSWVDKGIKYTAFAHATGGGSGARDKNINLKFRMQFSEAGVYLPNKRYSIVMPTHPNIRKNMKITLGGETWRVAGFDNISVKGVSYITLEETFQDEREDIPVANHSELDNWTITTSKGDNFTIENNEEIELLFSYKNEKIVPKFTIFGSENIEIAVRQETPIEKGELDKIFVKISTSMEILPENPHLKIYLEGWSGEDYLLVPFSMVPKGQTTTNSIVGPKEIYVGDVYEYEVNGANDNDFDSLKLDNDTADIIYSDRSTRKIKIKGVSIGKNKLFSENGLFSLSFEVLSMWLGGN